MGPQSWDIIIRLLHLVIDTAGHFHLMEYLDGWEHLTDPILLHIFTCLDAHCIFNVSLTCKHWNRVAQDEFIWKKLVQRKLGKEVLVGRHVAPSWKEEYKRLTYHVPTVVSEKLAGHKDEIYYVCFSPSGRFIGTTGADGIVKVWEYGNPTTLYTSAELCDPPSYVNYLEFNQSETLLLLNCVWKEYDETRAVQAVVSVHDKLSVLGARYGDFVNFRGTWLDDQRFLNADVFNYFFNNESIKFCALKIHGLEEVIERGKAKAISHADVNHVKENVSQSTDLTSFERDVASNFSSSASPGFRQLPEYCNDNNVTVSQMFKSTSLEYRPHFARVIDAEIWNSGHKNIQSSDESEHILDTEGDPPEKKKHQSDSEDLEVMETDDHDKILIIFQENVDDPDRHHIAFYRFSSKVSEIETEDIPEPSNGIEPFKVIVLKSGCLGVSLSHDQRYLVYNLRRIMIQGDEQWYNLSVDTLVLDLYSGCKSMEHYAGNMAVEETFSIYYFFASVSDHYVASGSERGCGYIWDRCLGTMLETLPHIEPGPKQVGVNAVAFHPNDEEILATVADDNYLRIWRSKERHRIHSQITKSKLQ